MQRSSSPRRSLAWRILTYTVMTIAVLAIVTVLTLGLLGFRFNSQRGTILQGGLVQFDSQPNNAKITVGTAKLAERTRSKITLNPGLYPVTMELDGYQTWRKNITVYPGKVLWLNSAHLVPTNPQTSSVLTTARIDSMIARPGGKYIALLKDRSVPTITLAKIDRDNVETEDVTLPQGAFTSAKKQTFTLEKWNDDDTHLLIKHDYDKKTEYAIANIDDATKSTAIIPEMQNNPLKDILFDPRSSTRVIVLYENGDVRTIDTANQERSNILIKNVENMTLTSANTLLYSTKPTKSFVTTGYLTLGTDSPRELQNVIAGTAEVHVSGGQYYDNFYLTTTNGADITVRKFDTLPSSDAGTQLSSRVIKTMQVDSPIHYVSSKGGNRFVVMQHAGVESVYDLELDKKTDTTIAGASKSTQAKEIKWFDEFHFWSDINGKLRQYEFDSANQTDITNVEPGYDAVYSPNQKYLYTVAKTSKNAVQLQRTQMIIKK